MPLLDTHSNATPNIVGKTMIDETITVEAGSCWNLQFIIPSHSSEIKVSGNFTVLGGSENEVTICIMNETTFKNRALFESGSFYDSGRVNNATITTALPSEGTYYLVLDNVFSASEKNVDIQANLNYYEFPK